MLTNILLGIVAGILVAVIVIATAVAIFRFRNAKKLQDAKRKMQSRFYIQETTKSPKGRTRKDGVSSIANRKFVPPENFLCNGIMQVTEQHEQLPLEEISIGHFADTSQEGSYTSLEAADTMSYPMRRPSSLTDLRVPDSANAIHPLRSPNTISNKLKHSKGYKSMSCIFHSVTKPSSAATTSSKPKKNRNHRPSLSLATPKYFDSEKEAMAVADEMTSSQKLPPEIVLSILYNDKTASLTATILCLNNMDQLFSCHQNIYVQAVLRPQYHQKQTTQVVSSLHPQFNECFYFDQVRYSDLATSHLLLTVCKSPGGKRVAELFLTLASIQIEYGKTLHCKFPLVTDPRSKKKSTLEKLLEIELGQLMILLRYQPAPNRLKIVVHKAVQLPKTDALVFRPDYQVCIELYRRNGHQPIESRLTVVQSGETPTWNEVFLFTLTTNNIDDHYLDFTVIEKRRFNVSDAIIGHVLLGPDSTSNRAINQWTDCSSPLKLEEGKWHSILPSVKFNMET